MGPRVERTLQQPVSSSISKRILYLRRELREHDSQNADNAQATVIDYDRFAPRSRRLQLLTIFCNNDLFDVRRLDRLGGA